jgi:hypothetical protein
VVRENLNTLYAAAEQGFAGAPLPDFVRAELKGYVDGGLLCRGFAQLLCGDCGSAGSSPSRVAAAASVHRASFKSSSTGGTGSWTGPEGFG